MNRGTTVAVVLAVAGATAALLYVVSPSTGPELQALEALEVEPAPVAPLRSPDVAAPSTSPSPRPTARKAVRRPDGAPNRGLGPFREGPIAGPGGGVAGIGRMRAAGALRDRYTREGHDKIMLRVEEIAAKQGWDDETFDEVEAILGDARERGEEALKHALQEGSTDRAQLAVTLKEIRDQEMKSLEQVLGAEEAGAMSRQAGLMGRRAMVKGPGGAAPPADR